ncbi:hypothetical protein ACQ4WX_47310 [Streptomyces lasalocidi]|uniref:hypothetical protein n=1 Tax=Streptomyces sp. MUSC 14 TaxID=1354889 RepID=UPI0009A0C642|nr:hypothetical protein [Streptomyces sp. MUSC 14]
MPQAVLALGATTVTASGCVWYLPARADLRAGADRPVSRRTPRACCSRPARGSVRRWHGGPGHAKPPAGGASWARHPSPPPDRSRYVMTALFGTALVAATVAALLKLPGR